MVVEEGVEVKVGDYLFFDKNCFEMKWVVLVSGEVIVIECGVKCVIIVVIIFVDKEQQYWELFVFDLDNSNCDQLVEYLLDVGVWMFFCQCLFNVVVDYNEVFWDIYILIFDMVLFVLNFDFIVEGQEVVFQKGFDVLVKLMSGSVYFGLNVGGDIVFVKVFIEVRGVK